MEKTIKYRLFHYYIEKPGVNGMSLVEKQAFFGETVDIPRQEDIERGEELDAFFTDKEARAIAAGEYDGPEADALAQKHMNPPFNEAEAAARGELPAGPATGIDPGSADAEEIAEHIKSQKLNVAETVALAGDDPELAKKVMEAEDLASENDARRGVEDGLQKIIDAAEESGEGDDEDQ